MLGLDSAALGLGSAMLGLGFPQPPGLGFHHAKPGVPPRWASSSAMPGLGFPHRRAWGFAALGLGSAFGSCVSALYRACSASPSFPWSGVGV